MNEEPEVKENTAPASDAETTQETTAEQPENSEHIDYKAELEREQRRLKQAEFTIQKLKAAQKEQPEETYQEPDDVETRIDKKFQEFEYRQTASRAQELARSKASTKDEEDLIMFHYQNSVKITGNVDVDVDNAYFLANKKRFQSNLNEAYKAVASKERRGNGAGSGQKVKQEAQVQLTPEEQKLVKMGLLTLEEARKAKQES